MFFRMYLDSLGFYVEGSACGGVLWALPIKHPHIFRSPRESRKTLYLLGTEVRPVGRGAKTLKDAMNEAIRDWVTKMEDDHHRRFGSN